MLIVALVLAVIGLAALVTAVVTSNEVIAWVCIAASSIGIVLLVVDAIAERRGRRPGAVAAPVDESADDEGLFEEDLSVAAGDGRFDVEAVEPVSEQTEIIEHQTDSATTEYITEPSTEASADPGADPGAEPNVEDLFDDGDGEPSVSAEDHPEEIVHDEPDYDTYSDDEPEYPEPAEESAMHTVAEDEAFADEEPEDQIRPDTGPGEH